ncbi:MAG: O-antigen ligase family protein [Phycisphaerales bacterium]|nr:O-antigen ligase family protein [Phycisphaerales bacterium]
MPNSTAQHDTVGIPWTTCLLIGAILGFPVLGYASLAIVATGGLLELRHGRQTLAPLWEDRALRMLLLCGGGLLGMIWLADAVHPGDVSWAKSLRLAIPVLVPLLLARQLMAARLTPSVLSNAAMWTVLACGLAVFVERWIRHGGSGIGAEPNLGTGSPLLVATMILPAMGLMWIDARRAPHAGVVLRCLAAAVLIAALASPLGARAATITAAVTLPLAMVFLFNRHRVDRHSIVLALASLIVCASLAWGAIYLAPHVSRVAFDARIAERVSTTVQHAMNGDFRHDTNVDARLDVWQAALDAGQHRPVFGWGFENERPVLIAHAPDDAVIPTTAHNQYLSFLLGGGVLGLGVGTLWLCAPLLAAARRTPKRPYLLTAAAITVPTMMVQLSDTQFDDMRVLCWYTSMALLVCCIQFGPDDPDHARQENSDVI